MKRFHERVFGLVYGLHHLIDTVRGRAGGAVPRDLSDLPIVPIVGRGAPGKRVAVFLSGDGGWASLPHRVSVHLARRGLPVIGLNVRRYFRRPHGPGDLARDLDRILRFYGTRLGSEEFVLIGFSFGAGALPFGLRALSDATRSRVRLMALLSPIAHAEFVFDWWAWLRFDVLGFDYVAPAGAPPVTPVLEELADVRQLMVFGSRELDGAQPWGAARSSRVVLPGGHHLGHRYRNLADVIRTALDCASAPLPEGDEQTGSARDDKVGRDDVAEQRRS